MLRKIQKDCSLAAELCFVHVTLLCLHLSLVKNFVNSFRYQLAHNCSYLRFLYSLVIWIAADWAVKSSVLDNELESVELTWESFTGATSFALVFIVVQGGFGMVKGMSPRACPFPYPLLVSVERRRVPARVRVGGAGADRAVARRAGPQRALVRDAGGEPAPGPTHLRVHCCLCGQAGLHFNFKSWE